MSRIFITGANGSIGRLLKSSLLVDGCEVIEPADEKLRIEDPEYFKGVKNPERIDVMYHLAASIFVPNSWQKPLDFIQVNTLGTTRILEFCREFDIKLIYVSSYIYGVPEYLPIDEKHPTSVNNPYALSKMLAEQICFFYGENYGLAYNIIRPFNVFGEVQKKELLIPEIIDQIVQNKDIRVEDLRPKRDYIFIDDVIDFLRLSKNSFNNEVYNLGTGKSHSVADIIAICQQIWGTDLKVISEGKERQNEISETLANIEKAREHFGWEPKYTFEEGLEQIKLRSNK